MYERIRRLKARLEQMKNESMLGKAKHIEPAIGEAVALLHELVSKVHMLEAEVDYLRGLKDGK